MGTIVQHNTKLKPQQNKLFRVAHQQMVGLKAKS